MFYRFLFAAYISITTTAGPGLLLRQLTPVPVVFLPQLMVVR